MATQKFFEVKSSVGGRFRGKSLGDARRYWFFVNFMLLNLLRNNIVNLTFAHAPSPSIPPPRGGREAKYSRPHGRETAYHRTQLS